MSNTAMQSEESRLVPAPSGKRRIPKACSACRQSKVKCDGKTPCTRCRRVQKQCVFFEIPKDPVSERVDSVESEVQCLRRQVDGMRELVQRNQVTPDPHSQDDSLDGQLDLLGNGCQSRSIPEAVPVPSPNTISAQPLCDDSKPPLTGRRSGFEVRDEPVTDFIDKGLLSLEYAVFYFNVFFAGCDRYIPIFDPEYDTFESVRSRSSILLNAICTIGCMVEARSGGPMPDFLHGELKKWINVIIQNKQLNCLESIQAMLVVACYSAERLLILSFATRMALDLGLHEAFDELAQRVAAKNDDMAYAFPPQIFEDERMLMRKARTWFGLLVLEHIFRVDGGKPPCIRLKGNTRRCRVLLGHPFSTVLDLRLLSQVELNVLRANVGDTLGGGTTLDQQSIADYVHDMKIELDLWFDDWLRIIESCPVAEEKPSLIVALRVQKCWAEMMLTCKALRAMGVENVAAMSPIERTILLTAKASARRHLRLIIADPAVYLGKLKYAMDFVWAKCAFSFLLLLKLSRLLPDQDEEEEQQGELLDRGNRLVAELSKAGAGAGAGNIYLQILKVSVEKYGRVLREMQQQQSSAPSPFWELFDAQTDLQGFVPEQFTAEWDFQCLNLFYFPTAWHDSFGDFSLAM